MATIKTGETIQKIAGGLGNHVFSSWRGRGVLREKSPNRANPCSGRQAAVRAGAAAVSKAWNDVLNDEQRSQWEEAAQDDQTPVDPASSREPGSRVVIPQPEPPPDGFAAFVAANLRALMTAIRALGNPVLVPEESSPNPPIDATRIDIPPFIPNFSLSLDGLNDYITCQNVLNYEYTSPFAWEFWINVPSTTPHQVIESKYSVPHGTASGHMCRLITGNLNFMIERGIAAEIIMVRRGFVTINSWEHVVMTYDGSNHWNGMHIYVNTVVGQALQAFTAITGTIVHNDPLYFGRVNLPTTAPFAGRMDCIRNFNRNLVQADVNVLFAGGAGLFSPDPFGDGSCQGYWPHCAGGGLTLFDMSGNNYHGTLVNMDPGDWVPGHVPCPVIPGSSRIAWTEPPVPAGSKVRVWLLSYDAHVHRQHVATVDAGVGFWELGNVRVAQGAEVPIASMPGHYLVQVDIISPGGNQSPPSNTIEITIP